MTKTFGVNENNDLFIGTDGNLVIRTGLLAVRDACANAAKAQLGEMVLDVNRGIPNFQTVWIGNPNIAQFEAALQKALSAVDGVTRVLGINTRVQNGVLSYTAGILTAYGQTVVTGFLNGIV